MYKEIGSSTFIYWSRYFPLCVFDLLKFIFENIANQKVYMRWRCFTKFIEEKRFRNLLTKTTDNFHELQATNTIFDQKNTLCNFSFFFSHKSICFI
jgi:hypothetical protein